MQKIILDTNIIVSALISNSAPTNILSELVLTQKVTLCISKNVFCEYVAVLNRDKFSKFSNFKSKADIVLNRINEISTFYEPTESVDLLQDKSDNKFLELALVSKSDYLITGNILDFTIKEIGCTKILTAREYWDLVSNLS